MTFLKNFAIAAAVVVAGMIAIAVASFVTGAGMQIPYLVDAPPRSGTAPALQLTFEPLGLVVVTMLGAALITLAARLRPVPTES